jgi:hypothetical protein
MPLLSVKIIRTISNESSYRLQAYDDFEILPLRRTGVRTPLRIYNVQRVILYYVMNKTYFTKPYFLKLRQFDLIPYKRGD